MTDKNNHTDELRESQRPFPVSGIATNQRVLAGNQIEARWQRILEATGAESDADLGRKLQKKPGSVASAKKSRIPPDWYLEISEEYGISIDWMVWGDGPKFRADRAAGHPPSAGPAPSEPKSVSIEDAPVERIKAWLTEIVKENPSWRGWLDIEFPKRFPEYREWLEKKQTDQSSEDSGPLNCENIA